MTAGTVYGLSICSDDALNVFGMVGSGERVHNGNTYASGFSNPFGPVWGSDTNGAMSIYASGSTETGNVASTYSNNNSSLLSSIPLTIVVVLVAGCITRLSSSFSIVKQKRKVQVNQAS